MSVLAHLQAQKKPRHANFRIFHDDLLVEAVNEALDRLSRIEMALETVSNDVVAQDLLTRKAEAEKAVADAREACAAASTLLVARAIGRDNYDALVRQYPPSPEDQEEQQKRFGPESQAPYNYTTFPPALCAASYVTTSGQTAFDSADEVNTLWQTWNNGEISAMWATALQVNTQMLTADLGKAYG